MGPENSKETTWAAASTVTELSPTDGADWQSEQSQACGIKTLIDTFAEVRVVGTDEKYLTLKVLSK